MLLQACKWSLFICPQSYTVSDSRKEDQKEVDTQLVPLIKELPNLRQYLAHRFSLSKGQYPHKLVF